MFALVPVIHAAVSVQYDKALLRKVEANSLRAS